MIFFVQLFWAGAGLHKGLLKDLSSSTAFCIGPSEPGLHVGMVPHQRCPPRTSQLGPACHLPFLVLTSHLPFGHLIYVSVYEANCLAGSNSNRHLIKYSCGSHLLPSQIYIPSLLNKIELSQGQAGSCIMHRLRFC